MKRSWPLLPFSVMLLVLLYAPILAIAVASVNASTQGATWAGFTWRWYESAIEQPAMLGAVRNSLVLALVSTAGSTLLGTLLGYTLGRSASQPPSLLSRFLTASVFLPDVIQACGLALWLGLLSGCFSFLRPGMTAMVLAHVALQLPFVALVVRSRVRRFPWELREAAQDLGASPAQAFFHVTLPHIAPGVVAAALLAFTLSLDDFVLSFFMGGPGSTTLPVFIFASLKRGLTPEVHALATALALASLLLVLILGLAWKHSGHRETLSPR